MGLDGTQFVEFGVKAAGDYAAVAHHGRGFGRNRRLQQRCAGWRRMQIVADARKQTFLSIQTVG